MSGEVVSQSENKNISKIENDIADLRTALEKMKSETQARRAGIWMEVVDVQFDSDLNSIRVQLKGDRAQPKPMWWPVEAAAVKATEGMLAQGGPYGTYAAILNEMDKKRLVLARLTCKSGSQELCCDVFRFQSSDSGSR